MDATAIILAAGEGTRMKSNHCKVSHKILGKPMVQWIVDATIKAGCSRVVVVIGSHADEMRALIDGAYANSATKVECVEQTERLGTGHAVRVALEGAAWTPARSSSSVETPRCCVRRRCARWSTPPSPVRVARCSR